ncbi:MAG: hypothetical protein WC554_04295 [Clostridia bacterium]
MKVEDWLKEAHRFDEAVIGHGLSLLNRKAIRIIEMQREALFNITLLASSKTMVDIAQQALDAEVEE